MINQARLVNTFLELVRIDAPSGQEEQIGKHIGAKFASLGLQFSIDPIHNLTVKTDGQGKPLFLSAHMDRVEPGRGINPLVEEGVIKSDGSTILGADDIAGVASILEGVQSMLEDGLPHLPLEIAFSCQEEVGLVGAKGIDVSRFRSREGVVLDSGGPVGRIIVASPSHNHINATITGKAAHAGVAPERGIDAIRVAAKAIAKMRLGRLDKETTANIGVIHGGSARNVVADEVQLVAEARSRNPRKLERQTRAMKQALERAAKPYSAKVDIHIERAYNQYKFGRRDRLVKRVQNALKSIGCTPRLTVTGGGSDANIYNAKRLRCVVASVGYEQNHTSGEYIPVGELVKAAELVVALALT